MYQLSIILKVADIMKIMVINPNTTEEMTQSIHETACKCARVDTKIHTVNPKDGPVSIENYYDEAFALTGILKEIRKGEQEGFDAYVIACANDPGLYAAREFARGPVIGIAEASMHMASLVAAKFSIVSLFPRDRLIIGELLHRYGMENKCVSIRTCNLAVLDFEKDPDKGLEQLAIESRNAVEKDSAEAICLGCAGMSKLANELEKDLGVPVFDGVAEAVKLAEALVDLGKRTSKALYFEAPTKKEYKGIYKEYEPK